MRLCIPFLALIFWLAAADASYAQSTFTSWSINPNDLVNGHIDVYAGSITSVSFTVVCQRPFDQAGIGGFDFKLYRYKNVRYILSSQIFSVAPSDYNSNGVATKTFVIELTSVGYTATPQNSYLRNGDEILISYKGGNDPNNFYFHDDGYPVRVELPLLEGNTVCCSECLRSDSRPTMRQQPGTAVIGGDYDYKFQWEESQDGVGFRRVFDLRENANLAESSSYRPQQGLTQTTWYRRTVKSGSTSSNGINPTLTSNVIKYEIVNALEAPTILATAYSENDIIKAFGTMTIQGDQTAASGVNIEFKSDTRIRVLPSSRLSAGIKLQAGSLCSTGSSGRQAASAFELTDIQATKEALPQTNEVSDRYGVLIYPNPSKGSSTIQYYVKQPGTFSISMCSSIGNDVTLMNDGNATPGLYTYQLDTQRFAQGIYLINLINNNVKETKRLSIIKE